MAKIYKWQQKIIDHVHTLSTEELFEYLLEECGPDDYDGGYTDRQSWEREYVINLIRKRLAFGEGYKYDFGYLNSKRRV